MDDAQVKELAGRVRKRAKNTRFFAKGSLFCIVLLVCGMLVFFLVNTRPIEYVHPAELLSDEFRIIQKLEVIRTEIDRIKEENKRTGIEAEKSVFIINTIAASIIKVGIVFLAVFLIQILVVFTRYHFKLSDHLDAVADAIEFSSGSLEGITAFVAAVCPKHIDFSKAPESPNEKLLGAVERIAQHITKK